MKNDGLIARNGDQNPKNYTTSNMKILILCAIAVMFDGFDNLILGFSIPSLLAEWHLERGDFISVVAISMISMSVGTAAFGWGGDRFGRKHMLVCSIFFFGLATFSGSFATNISMFTIFRALAALGLGGAFPNATALIAESTPLRRRSSAITLAILCVPLGGLTPLLLTPVILIIMPESPEFLARRAARKQKAGWVLRWKRNVKHKEQFEARVSFKAIFSSELRRVHSRSG